MRVPDQARQRDVPSRQDPAHDTGEHDRRSGARILSQHLRVVGTEGEGDHYPWKVYVNQFTGERFIPRVALTLQTRGSLRHALRRGQVQRWPLLRIRARTARPVLQQHELNRQTQLAAVDRVALRIAIHLAVRRSACCSRVSASSASATSAPLSAATRSASVRRGSRRRGIDDARGFGGRVGSDSLTARLTTRRNAPTISAGRTRSPPHDPVLQPRRLVNHAVARFCRRQRRGPGRDDSAGAGQIVVCRYASAAAKRRSSGSPSACA